MADAYNSPVPFKDMGDNLFMCGGDLFCTYPLLSVSSSSTAKIFEYEPYTITVTFDVENGVRKNPHWVREYKEAAT